MLSPNAFLRYSTDNDSIGAVICKRAEQLNASAIVLAKHNRGTVRQGSECVRSKAHITPAADWQMGNVYVTDGMADFVVLPRRVGRRVFRRIRLQFRDPPCQVRPPVVSLMLCVTFISPSWPSLCRCPVVVIHAD